MYLRVPYFFLPRWLKKCKMTLKDLTSSNLPFSSEITFLQIILHGSTESLRFQSPTISECFAIRNVEGVGALQRERIDGALGEGISHWSSMRRLFVSIYAVLFATSMQAIRLVADENEMCGEITHICCW